MKDLEFLISSVRELGLELNPNKCELIFANVPTCDQSSVFEKFNVACKGLSVTKIEDLVILGAPIGVDAARHCLNAKLTKFDVFSSNLRKVDYHHAFFLLKNCLHVPKLLYTLRSAPCFFQNELLQKIDTTVINSLESICNVRFDSCAQIQAFLPVKLGGLGIASVMQLAPAAFLASVTGCRTLMQTLLNSQMNDHCFEIALALWSLQVPEVVSPASAAQKE